MITNKCDKSFTRMINHADFKLKIKFYRLLYFSTGLLRWFIYSQVISSTSKLYEHYYRNSITSRKKKKPKSLGSESSSKKVQIIERLVVYKLLWLFCKESKKTKAWVPDLQGI